MAKSQDQHSLTNEQVQCGHCLTKAFMRVICKGEDSYEVGYTDEYGGDDVYHKWQTLKCLVCSGINVLQYSSSSLWEYTLDGESFVRPTYTDFLYPTSNKEEPLDLKISNQVVERAIADVEALLPTSGAVSGVDRIHTALHGYLRLVCVQSNIEFNKDDSITKLFKLISQQHPKFQSVASHSHIERLLKSFAGIMDSLNPIRNHASVAHPNEELLEKDEAELFINVVRTLLRYLDEKLKM